MGDHDRGSYREDRERYRPSRSDRESRRDDDRRDRYRDDHRRSSRYDDERPSRRDEDRRDRYSSRDDHKRSSRYEEDRPPRREHRPREEDTLNGRPERGERPERRGGGRKMGTPERRSPTPEGAIPLSQRRRKASGWDVHAPGYEQYSAMQAKQTGLFNLPGANRTQIPAILSIAGLPTPMPVQSFGMGVGGNPNLSRQSRRLYIGSITPDVNEQNLADFFNAKMNELNMGPGNTNTQNPVLAVQCNYEKNYAFVEFRSAEDATAAMAFDGIIFLNGPLKIRRPKDYGGESIPAPAVHVPGVVSTNVPDSINKIFIGGLPTYLDEGNVQELLTSFGELKAFNLVRENGTGPSKGFAFCEYVDTNVTDVAIQALDGMELGDKHLVVQRASVGAKAPDGSIVPSIPIEHLQGEIPKPIMPAGENTGEARILLMLNMVTPEDLMDDQDYKDLYDDIIEECSRFGEVEDLRLPRPVKKEKTNKWLAGEPGGISAAEAQRLDEQAGVGRVYVKYTDPEQAQVALKSLAGRSFAGRSIITTLLSEESQTMPPLHVIFAPQPTEPPPLPMPPS